MQTYTEDVMEIVPEIETILTEANWSTNNPAQTKIASYVKAHDYDVEGLKAEVGSGAMSANQWDRVSKEWWNETKAKKTLRERLAQLKFL